MLRDNYKIVRDNDRTQYECIVAFASCCDPIDMDVDEREKIERFIMQEVARVISRQ